MSRQWHLSGADPTHPSAAESLSRPGRRLAEGGTAGGNCKLEGELEMGRARPGRPARAPAHSGSRCSAGAGPAVPRVLLRRFNGQ